ncbi:hypothetical protein [Comamonas sp. SCN 65-56]|uniref:hypothetical protein n=1 Tax=Comamonas sp. SCN 65-56 TaxID=1660095 RepID=UPI0025C21644|nr:hypothetical protein [Comamonas sp. SCN 65-56]
MIKVYSTIAFAAGLLLAGSAFAATMQPAAGNAPYFDEGQSTTSTLQRADVRSAAIAQHPAVGNLSAAQPYTPSKLTRAQVHDATVQAIHNGFHVEVGNLTTL